MAIKIIGLLLYWGACLAAGCIYGIGAAVLVVAGAAFAGMVLCVDAATEGAEGRDSCAGCKHDLGGGQCRINLEAECGKGEHEMWEDKKMTIKGAYIAHAERHGDLVAIRLKGDEACLWMDMYLDLAQWQMTCDSDIGCYAYRFAKPRDAGGADFIGHFCSVAVNDGWLLRKCVDEMHLPKDFNAEKSAYALRDMVADAGADKEYQNKLDEIIDAAYAYDGNKDAWLTAIHIGADSAGIDLPEEWWECLTAGYTPRQRYFARLCSEVIAPELRRMMQEDGINGDG